MADQTPITPAPIEPTRLSLGAAASMLVLVERRIRYVFEGESNAEWEAANTATKALQAEAAALVDAIAARPARSISEIQAKAKALAAWDAQVLLTDPANRDLSGNLIASLTSDLLGINYLDPDSRRAAERDLLSGNFTLPTIPEAADEGVATVEQLAVLDFDAGGEAAEAAYEDFTPERWHDESRRAFPLLKIALASLRKNCTEMVAAAQNNREAEPAVWEVLCEASALRERYKRFISLLDNFEARHMAVHAKLELEEREGAA